jgi:hypothetical protein
LCPLERAPLAQASSICPTPLRSGGARWYGPLLADPLGVKGSGYQRSLPPQRGAPIIFGTATRLCGAVGSKVTLEDRIRSSASCISCWRPRNPPCPRLPALS